VPKFQKKPVVIEARQVTDGDASSVAEWCGGRLHCGDVDLPGIYIKTLEGEMLASPGDWVIKGVKGEFYPCKPDIFEATYVDADAPRCRLAVRCRVRPGEQAPPEPVAVESVAGEYAQQGEDFRPVREGRGEAG